MHKIIPHLSCLANAIIIKRKKDFSPHAERNKDNHGGNNNENLFRMHSTSMCFIFTYSWLHLR